MNKRVISIALAAAMAMICTTGCGGSDSKSDRDIYENSHYDEKYKMVLTPKYGNPQNQIAIHI